MIHKRFACIFLSLFLIIGMTNAAAEDVNIIFLGDIHFDKPEHHPAPSENETQFERRISGYYSRIAADNLPPLLDSVRAVAALAIPHVSLFVQSGDFVDGLCGSYKLARLQFEDFTAYIDSLDFNAPFCVVQGNHDIAGEGNEKAYEKVIHPWLKQQIGLKPKRGCYAIPEGDVLFLFYNSYDDRSLDWLEKTIRKSDKRRFVVICHKPVVPFQARSTWIQFPGASQKDKRERLLNILGEVHAIVLCGHLHDYGLVARKTDTGSFVQLSISSVYARTRGNTSNLLSGIDNYSGALAEQESYFSRGTLEERKQILEAEKPFITHFEFSNNYGFAHIVFSDDAVNARIYEGTDRTVWRTVELTSLMEAE